MLRYAGRERAEGDHSARDHRTDRDHRNGARTTQKDDDPTTPKSAAVSGEGYVRQTAGNGMF
jgi:hypothetical protein